MNAHSKSGLSRTERALRSHVKLRQLKLLVTLDDYRHLGRAAEALGITQPAVSKSLAEVEMVFGVQLFTRSVRGTAPTADGELVIQLARLILSELDRTVEELAARAQGITGRVCIGTVGPGAHLLLARTVVLLKKRSAMTTVVVEEEPLEVLLQQLRIGKVDIVLSRIDPAFLDDDIEAVRLYDEPAVVICGPGHPLTQLQHIETGLLAEHPWVVPTRSGSMLSKLKEMFGIQGHEPPADLTVGLSMLSALLLVQERQAVCLLAQSVARHLERSGLVTILPVRFPLPLVPVGMLYRRTPHPSVALSLLLECVRQAAIGIQAEP